jgi:Peptidase family M28
MKKSMWLVLLVLGTIAVISISGLWKQPERPPVVENTQLETAQPQVTSTPTVNTPQISTDKLFAHIQNLNYKRYTVDERSRARVYINNELKKLGWKPKQQRFAEGINIFAERPGTDKAAGTILVGAHYDTVSVSPGADDNGSGVAVVLEIARLFASRPTPRTLQLALFDKEETGLLGSKAFVAKKSNLKNLRGAIVMDMVGYACYTSGCQQYPKTLPIIAPSDKGDFLVVIGDTEHLPLLNTFQRNPPTSQESGGLDGDTALPAVLRVPIPLKGLLTPDTLRSDHAPFWYQGVGAVLVTDTANLRTPHYHQPSDTPTTIDRKFFNSSAQIVANATYDLLESKDLLTTPTSN